MGFWCFVTSISYISPGILCAVNKLYMESLMFLFMTIASSLYHIDEYRDEHMLIDMVGITIVLSYVIHVTMEGLLFVNVLNLLAVLIGCVALSYWFASPDLIPGAFEDIEETMATLELYDRVHSMWHILTSVSMTLIVYSYVQTNVKKKHSVVTKRLYFSDITGVWTQAMNRMNTMRKSVDPWKLMTLMKPRKGAKGD